MAIPHHPTRISVGTVRNEFGGNTHTRLGLYYAGGSYTPSGTVGYPRGSATNVPTSGRMSIGNFHGSVRMLVVIVTSSQNVWVPEGYTRVNGWLVGGGGGGAAGTPTPGWGCGGGGGGGGVLQLSNVAVSGGRNYYCTIGGGGQGRGGGVGGNMYGGNGGNTTFAGRTAYGGGGGGGARKEASGEFWWRSSGHGYYHGTNGGSGGGGAGGNRFDSSFGTEWLNSFAGSLWNISTSTVRASGSGNSEFGSYGTSVNVTRYQYRNRSTGALIYDFHDGAGSIRGRYGYTVHGRIYTNTGATRINGASGNKTADASLVMGSVTLTDRIYGRGDADGTYTRTYSQPKIIVTSPVQRARGLPGNGISGQGNEGYPGVATRNGGGGGGAGGPATSRNGGPGRTISVPGYSRAVGGGGGGGGYDWSPGAGGSGGGGSGAQMSRGGHGAANTGGGGGGAGEPWKHLYGSTNGGDGGSGIALLVFT